MQSATDHQDESELTVPRGTRSSVQGAVDSRRKRSPGYAFADCRLDTQAYLLDRAGLAIPLRPKVFHALQFLIEHRDRTVTKDELCAHVWPDQFISDATIESCIKHVRQAIGDDGRGQKLIQTRKGFGYRFVGKVEEQSAPTSTEAIAETLPRSIEEPPQSGAAEPLSAPRAERKLVTLLGCTLAAGGAELGALHRQMRILYALAAEEVQRYGGTIHSVAGTRLLATFGAPIALENHARLALLAALQLQERFAAPCGDLCEESMSACLALHTGFVVVGDIGDGRPSTIVGNLTVAVEALQEHRLPDVLLCSEATARLIRDDVRLEEVAPVSTSGEHGFIRTYKVTGPCLRHPSRALVDVRTLSPFVGRGHELRALHAILDQVADGRGQSVGIVGEPGIGKSRLLFEFSQQLHTDGPVTYLEGHCLSYTRATPYSLVLEVLRAHCAIATTDGDDVIAEKVHRTLGALGVDADRTAACLLHLLGVRSAVDMLSGTSPDTLKAQTFAALKQVWTKSGQRRPLVIALEDMHWIDPTSEEFVTTLVDGLPGAAVLLLATYRPGYRAPWVAKSYTTQLTLPPLSARDSVHVVQAVLHQETALPPLADAILAKAEGNPFFLEELAHMLVQRQIPADASPDRSGTPLQSIDLHLPPTVEAVLAARIDRLSIEAKHLLQTAAVVGVDVPISLLRLVAESTESAFNAHLAELQAAELLNESHRSRDAVYTFKHALTQEVAYGSLLNEHRRELHARILDALETLAVNRDAEHDSRAGLSYPRPQYLEQLAYHAMRGDAWAEAVVYSRQAGEKAMARSAHREAASYFEQAIHALAHLPDTRDTREQAIDLRLALRSALHPCGELRRAMACVGEAEVLAKALDDPPRLAEVSVALSLHCYLSGAYSEAIAAATRVATLAPDTAIDQRLRAALHLAIAYQARGDYRRAIDCLSTMAARLDETTGRTRWGELIPAVFVPAYLAACHAELGTFAEGTSMGNSGLEIAEAVDHPMSRAFAAWGAGLVALRQGKLSRAASVLERVVNPCQDDRPAWFPLLAAALGATYTGAGRIDDARVLLRQALELAVATEIVVNQAVCSVGLADAELQAGHLDEADALADRALSLARAHGERGSEAYALHVLGEIFARRVPIQRVQAEDHYVQSLALAETLGMQPLQAHCRYSLSTLFAITGRRKLARTELSKAIEQYRAMEMNLWLGAATAALARMQ